MSIFSGFKGDPGSAIFWSSVEPVGVLIAAIVTGIMLLARARRSAIAAAMVTAFGIQTTLFFAFYAFEVYPPAHHGAGGYLGMLGGLALIAAGLLGLAAARQRPAASGAGQVS